MVSRMNGVLALVMIGLSLAGLPNRPAVADGIPAAAAGGGETFATPAEGVEKLVAALRVDDRKALRAVLGPGSDKLLNSGDKILDAQRRARFLSAYDERHELAAADEPDHTILKVGNDGWSLPIPLVQVNGEWHFDSAAGAQELVDRWIGRNEIAAIRTALAYVDAQKAFFANSGEYAQRLLSTPGKHDGLYWIAAEGEPESPLAPLVEQARDEGYPVDSTPGRPRQPYQGYYFRILTAQGADTPNGARDYVSNGRMTNGFALVAWPATYGTSGIMTFIVNQDGIVYQRDLGRRTATLASTMPRFDPDLSWTRVDIIN